MRIAEQRLVAKTARPADCEDGIVVSEAYAAVIDGATDKTGLLIGGETGGRAVMRACGGAVRCLPEDADARSAIDCLSAAVDSVLPAGLPRHERPEAAVLVFSLSRREIWQVGDVGFWHEGVQQGGRTQRKRIDKYAAELRAGLLSAELASGADPAELAASDPGRVAIQRVLERQGVFRNNPGAGSWAYGAVDGRHVPGELITVSPVPAGIGELVIASDGYPYIAATLDESELRLAELLDADPLCIGPLLGTKGQLPGNVSFDDRAYLRIRL